MELPEGVTIRRSYDLTESQTKTLQEWLEVKRLANKRIRDAQRRYLEATAIFEGQIAQLKWDMGWATADNVVFDDKENKLLDLINDGPCPNCGQNHAEEEE